MIDQSNRAGTVSPRWRFPTLAKATPAPSRTSTKWVQYKPKMLTEFQGSLLSDAKRIAEPSDIFHPSILSFLSRSLLFFWLSVSCFCWAVVKFMGCEGGVRVGQAPGRGGEEGRGSSKAFLWVWTAALMPVNQTQLTKPHTDCTLMGFGGRGAGNGECTTGTLQRYVFDF